MHLFAWELIEESVGPLGRWFEVSHIRWQRGYHSTEARKVRCAIR